MRENITSSLPVEAGTTLENKGKFFATYPNYSATDQYGSTVEHAFAYICAYFLHYQFTESETKLITGVLND